jgi:signal peptidase I
MQKKHHWVSTLFAVILLLLALLAWIYFAPIRLGGHNEYILINGTSMEPDIKANDLIIVREADVYQVGDAVAYRNPALNVVVFHRIVGKVLDGFILKGDNNDWEDSYIPTYTDIIGKQWGHFTKIGKIFVFIRQPLFLAILVALTGGITLEFLLFNSKKKKKVRNSNQAPISKGFTQQIRNLFANSNKAAPDTSHPGSQPYLDSREMRSAKLIKAREMNGTIEIVFLVLGFAFILSLALGLFAFLNPVTHLTTQQKLYQQTGSYAYTAAAPAGVYDSQSLKSGDPIFTKLTCNLNFTFKYLLLGEGLNNFSGSYQTTAVLSDPSSGWTRVIPLEPQRSFDQGKFTSLVQMDLCTMQSIIKEMETQTGMAPYTYYLSINPLVVVSGKLEQAEFFDTFTAPLIFQMDAVHASLVKADPLVDPLNPTKDGAAEYELLSPNSLSILSLDFPVSLARTISLIGFSISLIGFPILFLIISKTAKQSKEISLRLKYGSSMVDVEPTNAPRTRSMVDLLTMDDLALLAERNNKVIFHEKRGWLHTYQVEADQITYRFTLAEIHEDPDTNLHQANHISAFNLHEGITKGEFQVYYQPIISLLDRKIQAVEALLRWERPNNGLVEAKDFIVQAENTGLIDTLGEWVLLEASKQVKEWHKNGLPLRLVVNFSRRQIEMHPAQLIAQVLKKNGMSLDDLQIEISETSLIKNPELIFSNLTALQKMGVHLSVDGYTGISSLTNLKQIPFESIKIDRSLIKQLDQREGAEYVQAIISAVLERGLNVVAEGVENHFQMNLLRSHFCSQAQGFLIAQPAPADKISTLLLKHVQC